MKKQKFDGQSLLSSPVAGENRRAYFYEFIACVKRLSGRSNGFFNLNKTDEISMDKPCAVRNKGDWRARSENRCNHNIDNDEILFNLEFICLT
jgi:hypothetical protein